MPQGRVGTYDLTQGVIIEMDDAIYQIDPFDVPLLGTFGADGRTTLSTDSCHEKKVEWQDDTLLTPRTTASTISTTDGTSITIASANKFGVGDVILIDAEYLYVSAVNSAGTGLTVTRGYNSSTAATHASAATVVGVGTALVEGSDPEAFRSTDRSGRYNYTQIFGPHKVSLTGTEMVVRKYGTGSNEWGYQTGKKVKETLVSIEQALLYGKVSEDTSAETRTMGGMINFITTNVDSSTTTITEAKLLDQMQAVFDAGGSVDRIVVGSKQKRVISAFAVGITVNVNRPETVRGQTVDTFTSDFGQVSVLLDRWCRVSDVFGFSRDQATVKTLRPLQMEMLAKTGDSQSAQLLAEKTLKFEAEKHSFRFSALT